MLSPHLGQLLGNWPLSLSGGAGPEAQRNIDVQLFLWGVQAEPHPCDSLTWDIDALVNIPSAGRKRSLTQAPQTELGFLILKVPAPSQEYRPGLTASVLCP